MVVVVLKVVVGVLEVLRLVWELMLFVVVVLACSVVKDVVDSIDLGW